MDNKNPRGVKITEFTSWTIQAVPMPCAVVGLKEAKKLLENIPNKARDILGIIVEVNLRTEGALEYLEIEVEPYPYPISHRGKYYQRSGSTLQELKGAALDRFILRKQGKTWDGVPVPHVSLTDLSPSLIKRFRAYAKRSGRVSTNDLKASDTALIDKLKLTEGDYLKRAAVLLFHDDPETYVSGAFIKIGFFRSESDLAYHDEVHGDLFTQVERSTDLILTKYFKAAISYEGIQRVETYPVPEAALREALLNAVVHRDYGIYAPIQIRIYHDHMKLWNPAILPDGWDLKKLLGEHASHPFNPDIANTFFRAGEIETWGRGIHRIFAACNAAGAPKPKVRYTPNDLWLEFPFSKKYLAMMGEDSGKKTGGSSVESSVETADKVLNLLERQPKWTLATVAGELGLSVRAIEKVSKKLTEAGKLRRVGPKKGGHWEILK
jgi:ATP-dependent DNA helicase RecG